MSLRLLITDQQMGAIHDAGLSGRERHPAWSAMFNKQADATDWLTREAARTVASIPSLASWRQRLGVRIADLGNWHDAASALSELRVIGALLEAGLDPAPLRPKGQATPDFGVDLAEGPLIIEVFSKHEDAAQTQQRQAVAAGEDVPGVERKTTLAGVHRITSTTQVLHPGGAPDPNKPGDSVQANVISRLCAAKGKESQIPAGVPGLLWLDLSNFGVMTETFLEQCEPIMSGHGGLTAGAIWYAFYGWKGAPIIEEWRRRSVTMQHDGRYRLQGKNKSRLSATLVSFEKGLVLLENPWAENRLPASFRSVCLRLPWFRLGHSIADWSSGEAEALVSIARRRIETLAERSRD